MKYIYTLLLFSVFQIFYSQDSEVYANGVFNFEEQKNNKVFTDGTRVRQKPSFTADIIDSLAANQDIRILEKTQMVAKLGERGANWYRISYKKENRNFEGYLWGGNLAIAHQSKNGIDFLFGIHKTGKKRDQNTSEDYPQNFASVKVMKNEQLLNEQVFETGLGESLSYTEFSIENNHQLKNVDFILKTMVSGEACGIPTFDQYLLYTDQKLVLLPQLTNVGDADIYYHSEEFVFPDQKGGKPNYITLKITEMERDENDKENISSKKEVYIWNGNMLKKQ